MDVDSLAKVLWDYHHMNQTLEKADCIFVLGGHDLRVPEYGAQLYLDGYAPWLAVSGGVAHKGDLLQTEWGSTEAEKFSAVAIAAGVPKERILVEDKATNTGENFTYMQKVFEEKHLTVDTVILVQKPYMERRTWATARIHWPDKRIIVTSQPIPYDKYVRGAIPKDAVIHIMVGDLQRIREYPALGFQVPQEIPDEVWNAYEQLVRMGYNKHLVVSVT